MLTDGDSNSGWPWTMKSKADSQRVKSRSWNVRIPTTGGPVSYLNIFDGQVEIRIPETVRMGEGTYTYSHTGRHYRWQSGRSDGT
jgi:hypothetical protein